MMEEMVLHSMQLTLIYLGTCKSFLTFLLKCCNISGDKILKIIKHLPIWASHRHHYPITKIPTASPTIHHITLFVCNVCWSNLNYHHRAVGSYLESLEEVVVMVVEDEWGDIVAYASAAGNSVAQTARNSSYLAQIREKYPKVSLFFCI